MDQLKKSQSLYDMATIFNDLQNRDDLNPEILKDTLDSLTDSMADKIDHIASWMDANQKDSDFYSKKIKLLQQAKKSVDNKNKSLNHYIVDSMDQAGIKNLKTPHFRISMRSFRQSTVVEDVSKLSPDYVDVVTTYKPNKTKIYKKLKTGEKVLGAHLEPNRKAVIK
mgnify:CR=1 FL=1